jgi:hypothetical protein
MYYKSLTVDLKSWHDGTTEWTPGTAMPPINGPKGDPCGEGYHLAKTVNDAVGFGKFPLSLWDAEPCGELLGEDDTKARFVSAKIVREIKKPIWVRRTEKFIASIASVKWLDAHDKPRKAWKLFDTRAAAWDAAWAAAWDAALQAMMGICCDLRIDKKYRNHAKSRWDVWTRGYGMCGDVDGVLYCYRKI